MKHTTTENQTNKAVQPVPLARLVVPLPCPFCGCKPKVKIERDRWSRKFYRVRCTSAKCYVWPQTCTHGRTGIPFFREDAITAWNLRQNDQVAAPATLEPEFTSDVMAG